MATAGPQERAGFAHQNQAIDTRPIIAADDAESSVTHCTSSVCNQ